MNESKRIITTMNSMYSLEKINETRIQDLTRPSSYSTLSEKLNMKSVTSLRSFIVRAGSEFVRNGASIPADRSSLATGEFPVTGFNAGQ